LPSGRPWSSFTPASRALDGLEAEQAVTKLAGWPHSIAEVVAHMLFWQRHDFETIETGVEPPEDLDVEMGFVFERATNEIVVEHRQGRTSVTLRGPESGACLAECPSDTEWLGVRLRVGTFFHAAPPGRIRDGRDVTCDPTEHGFVVGPDRTVPLPGFGDAETFVDRLAAAGYIRHDAFVAGVFAGATAPSRAASVRTIQRRFAQVTGLTREAVFQIERARFAAFLLQQGGAIAEAVFLAGYADQAHLSRALRRYVGVTPGVVVRGARQLSLLYKTDATPWAHIDV
jgi:AraC-like DNA-binding protein